MKESPEYQQEIKLPLKAVISVAVDGFEPALRRNTQGTTGDQQHELVKELIYRIESELDDKQLPDNLRERIADVLISTITTSAVVEGETLKTDVDLQNLKGKLEFTLQELDTSGT